VLEGIQAPSPRFRANLASLCSLVLSGWWQEWLCFPATGEYLETLGPVWEAATPQGRKEIHQLVLEAVYVDVLEKKLVKVVPKGAFAPLFGGEKCRIDTDRE